MVRSKYEEDVHPSNHTSVWGSFWQNGQWGFKCCHSFIKNSYCTGEAGKRAAEFALTGCIDNEEISSSNKNVTSNSISSGASDSCAEETKEEEIELTTKDRKRLKKKQRKDKKKQLQKQDKDKLSEALEKEDSERHAAEMLLKVDERKRPYNSMYENKKLSPEEIEAFQMKRMRDEDPMSSF